ncbi:nuclear cap-binding protein subunit 1 [Senna tora]|uniref:Nuclear cap-binding protein subunit 1 n=1 Tax=Senna tora TaxID=362788 RepID=A0A834SD08_9FABA|nr:nuclear cap-binding protein subunit 1 [Senna tora]
MLSFLLTIWCQLPAMHLVAQVPEEIERVMVGIEAYLSIRRHTSDSGLSYFENNDETERSLGDKLEPRHDSALDFRSLLYSYSFRKLLGEVDGRYLDLKYVSDGCTTTLALIWVFNCSMSYHFLPCIESDYLRGLLHQDFLEDLWDRIQSLSNNGWKVDSVPRPHLSFEAQLVAGKSHEFGPISCPDIPNPPSTPSGIASGKQKHEAELKFPQRIRRLNIFPPNKTEDLQPIDRFVVEEYLLDVLQFFNGW